MKHLSKQQRAEVKKLISDAMSVIGQSEDVGDKVPVFRFIDPPNAKLIEPPDAVKSPRSRKRSSRSKKYSHKNGT